MTTRKGPVMPHRSPLTSQLLQTRAAERVLDDYTEGEGVIGAVECKTTDESGAITGPRESTMTLEFKGCESSGRQCTSTGASAGTINTSTLDGTLGFLNETKDEIGILLKAPGEVFSEFSCEGENVKTTGSVVAQITPNWTVTFAVGEDGEQSFTHLEGKEEDHVLTGENPEVGSVRSSVQAVTSVKAELTPF